MERVSTRVELDDLPRKLSCSASPSHDGSGDDGLEEDVKPRFSHSERALEGKLPLAAGIFRQSGGDDRCRRTAACQSSDSYDGGKTALRRPRRQRDDRHATVNRDGKGGAARIGTRSRSLVSGRPARI